MCSTPEEIVKYLCVLLYLISRCQCKDYTFPDGFRFGVATASYQVEGAWNVSGKGENIWDRLTHSNPEAIADLSNGDIACDTYSKTKEDVQLLKFLGVDFYRFSISWSRILPSGKKDYVNPDGIRYYNELIDELLANGITPMVTMFHWDLPQPLEDEGGWTHCGIVDYFVDYADVLYENFGDRVTEWATFNEPYVICQLGYGGDFIAPMRNNPKTESYLCGHYLLLAHANAYHLYNEKYREIQRGRVGFVHNIFWFEPMSSSVKDMKAADDAIEFVFGWFANPIYSKEGDYPQVMKGAIEYESKKEGLSASRLPTFTPEEIKLIRGSADYLGVNHYTTLSCSQIGDEDIYPGMFFLKDMGVTCVSDHAAEGTASIWLKVMPQGFRKSLNRIREQYDNPEVIITENGMSNFGNLLHDCGRVSYYNSYLTEMLKAIHVDGCKVTGYTAWSFLDNFEWRGGYREKFGLFSVDFENPKRPRTPKMSAHVYKKIIEERKINWKYTPEGFPECEWLRIKDEL